LPEQPELPLLEELPADPKIIKKKTLSSGNSAVRLTFMNAVADKN
jgi:hypothetical protein